MKEVIELAQTLHKQSVNIYTLLFCSKHGFDVDNGYWVGDELGGVYFNADYFFNYEVMRYDIDNNIDEDMLLAWYEYSLEAHEKKEFVINFQTYTKLDNQKMATNE